jgi:NitT/TauT family transport system permease protein
MSSLNPEAEAAGLLARPLTPAVRTAVWRRLGTGGRPLLRLTSLALFLVAWHAATAWELDLYVRFTNIPSPARVLEEAIKLFASTTFYVHIGASLERIYLGFALATVLGVGLGLLIGWFRFAEDVLFPPIELVRPIPAVAWVPLAIMLWPTERSSIVFITGLGAFFPIVLNTIHGVEGIDRGLVRAATSLGAGPASIFREVVIPGAMPSIVTGLSVGMGVSWICLISAEMISGQYGIGYYTWVAYGIVKYSSIVVGMLTIGVLGMVSSLLIRVGGAWLMPWRERSAKENS